jgi:hypothetical protein
MINVWNIDSISWSLNRASSPAFFLVPFFKKKKKKKKDKQVVLYLKVALSPFYDTDKD